MAIHIEHGRGVQQDGAQPNAQLDGRPGIGLKYSVDDMSVEREQGENHSHGSHGGVVPAQRRRAPHQAGRDEDAQGHGDQEKLADEEGHRGGGEGIKNVMQGIRSPCQLPGAEVWLAALLMDVGEDEEQQESDNSWYDHHT